MFSVVIWAKCTIFVQKTPEETLEKFCLHAHFLEKPATETTWLGWAVFVAHAFVSECERNVQRIELESCNSEHSALALYASL